MILTRKVMENLILNYLKCYCYIVMSLSLSWYQHTRLILRSISEAYCLSGDMIIISHIPFFFPTKWIKHIAILPLQIDNQVTSPGPCSSLPKTFSTLHDFWINSYINSFNLAQFSLICLNLNPAPRGFVFLYVSAYCLDHSCSSGSDLTFTDLSTVFHLSFLFRDPAIVFLIDIIL